MSQSPAALLAAALKADSARPFVTFYDEQTGERIELSVATFANWVAKTANLLVDGLGLGAGDTVRLDLPRHWQTPVWAVAAWSAGLIVDVSGNPSDADVVVCGPAGLAAAQGAPEVVALSLKPMGAPFPIGALPAGVLDYAREVAGYGDRFGGALRAANGPFYRTLEGSLTLMAALERTSEIQRALRVPTGGRFLLGKPTEVGSEILASALLPLAVNGSVVLVIGAELEQLTRIAALERTSPN